MEQPGQVSIREFREDDLEQVSVDLISGFKDKFRHITALPPDEMLGLLLDTGLIYPYPYPGYIVAEDNRGVIGAMMLAWKGQKRPEFKLEFVKTARKYGWLRLIRLLFGTNVLEPSPRKGECYIDRISVRTDARGKGAGTRLLERAKEIAIRNGLPKLTLYVVSDNEGAIELYKRFGFKIIRTQKSLLTKWILGTREWHHMMYRLEDTTDTGR